MGNHSKNSRKFIWWPKKVNTLVGNGGSQATPPLFATKTNKVDIIRADFGANNLHKRELGTFTGMGNPS